MEVRMRHENTLVRRRRMDDVQEEGEEGDGSLNLSIDFSFLVLKMSCIFSKYQKDILFHREVFFF